MEARTRPPVSQAPALQLLSPPHHHHPETRTLTFSRPRLQPSCAFCTSRTNVAGGGSVPLPLCVTLGLRFILNSEPIQGAAHQCQMHWLNAFLFPREMSSSEHLQPDPGHVGQGLGSTLVTSSEMTGYHPLLSFLY